MLQSKLGIVAAMVATTHYLAPRRPTTFQLGMIHWWGRRAELQYVCFFVVPIRLHWELNFPKFSRDYKFRMKLPLWANLIEANPTGWCEWMWCVHLLGWWASGYWDHARLFLLDSRSNSVSGLSVYEVVSCKRKSAHGKFVIVELFFTTLEVLLVWVPSKVACNQFAKDCLMEVWWSGGLDLGSLHGDCNSSSKHRSR